jgi:purine-binding chemotaxis protein CheW
MQTTKQLQYVQFGIEKERYAIRIDEIHEIIKMQDITLFPNVKPYVKGVINLRGKVVPVLSLRQLFGMPEISDSKTTRIIVVRHREDTIGVIVDHVSQVTTFADTQTPPERFGGIDGNYLAQIGMTDGGMAGILRLDEVLLHN